MPTAAVCVQPTPVEVLLVADEDVDVVSKADCAACNAADALLTLAETWLSWERMDVEAAASAVESLRPSEDEAEAAEEVRFVNSLLNSLIASASKDPTKLGKAAMSAVKLVISLIKSRGSMAGAEVISGFWSVPSACLAIVHQYSV